MPRRFPALLLAPLVLGGCGLLGGAPRATYGAHVVFLTRPACSTLVAQTLATGDARAFSVLTLPDAGYAPTAGDVIEGPAREGPSVFVVYPLGTDAREGGLSVSAEVLALGLRPGEARLRLDDACGPPPRRPDEGGPPVGF